jgi:hypothetical protein
MFNDIKRWVLFSLTLGLAPFSPEPHIWGKLKWVLGGAEGMQLMDWGDLLMHGAPWIGLIIAISLKAKEKFAS